MNNPQVRAYAEEMARRISPASKIPLPDAVAAGYLRALGRLPKGDELTDSVAFLRRQTESYRAAGNANASQLALAEFCQALMCVNEFVYAE